MVYSYPRQEPRLNLRTRRNGGGLLVLAGLCAVAALAGGAWWLLRPRGVTWAAQRGLSMVGSASTPAETATALAAWEQETGSIWHDRRDALADYLLDRWADPSARTLLARAARVDFGDRREDWQRFERNWRRIRKGDGPAVNSGERIKLQPMWNAPVGLTAWFSPILALDGRIYVASLGRKFEDPADDADGVIVVDGVTGASDYLFRPEGRGALDVLGLAVGRNCVFVAARSGAVYCIDPAGQRRWSAAAGASLLSPPLSADLNRDTTPDVVVMTVNHRVVALNGETGRTLWQRDVHTRGVADDSEPAAYQTLSAGNVWTSTELNVVVTTAAGVIAVLGPGGEVRWTERIDAGFIGGSICATPTADGAPTLFAADRQGVVRAYVRSGRGLKTLATWNADPTGHSGVIASLRTLRSRPPEAWPFIIAATSGEPGRAGGTLSACAQDGVRWRCPLRGSVWGGPAVADLSGDGKPEIIVLSNGPGLTGVETGYLQVVSGEGHLVADHALEAPVDSAPVVADVDGDGKLDLLWADRSGLLYSYDSNRAGPVEWGAAGGDVRNSSNAEQAFSFGQRAHGFQWTWRPE